MPLLDEVKNVLSFAAFRPDPDDAATPWGKRFAGRRTLLLNVSRTHTSWCSVNKRGRFNDTAAHEGEFNDVATAHADEWRNLTDNGWCSVSLNNRFIISLENSISRREKGDELMRVNPKAILGAKFDRGKRYAIYHHPENTTSILMACDDSFVKFAEDGLRANGLKAGRVSCGLFALMQSKLEEIYTSSRPEAKGSFLLIVCCEGSIAAIAQREGQWTDLRCRSGVGTDSVDPMLQIVAPLAQKLEPGTPVFFLHDGNDKKFSDELLAQLNPLGAQDVTTEDMLWKMIGVN